jgi:hypothetical protein
MAYAERPRLGISSCVVGQKVRYDGTAKRDRWVVEQLGLGTPRPPIRLVGTPDAYRVVGVSDPSVDVTEALEAFALDTAATLGDISGYVFMSKSPSCDARPELADSIEAYRREEIPLVVPVTLLRSWFRRHPDDYIGAQWYLDPYPESLGLGNAI